MGKATPGKRRLSSGGAQERAPQNAALLQKADRIRRQLAALYPSPAIPLDHTSNFQLLVAVMLSAQVRSGGSAIWAADLERPARRNTLCAAKHGESEGRRACMQACGPMLRLSRSALMSPPPDHRQESERGHPRPL